MPELLLADDLLDQLEDSETGTIDNMEGSSGVASYSSTDGRTRAIVNVGLKLDGVNLYASISNFDPSIEIRFALEPIISCSPDVSFTPEYDTIIAIQVHAGALYTCLLLVASSQELDVRSCEHQFFETQLKPKFLDPTQPNPRTFLLDPT